MDRIIAYHCAPALAGIKPSNIVTCYKSRVKDIYKEVERLNRELNGKDIYFEILCECKERVLLMVYRKKVLGLQLEDKEIKKFLAEIGYPEQGDCDSYISFLKHRLEGKEFSHEIGAFLGYPLHDIYGFINHRDEGCLLCGEWKVYKNAEEAEKLFHRFSVCRKAVSERVENGKSLTQIFS